MAKKPVETEKPENEVVREARRQIDLAERQANEEREASRARVRNTDKDASKKGLDWKAAAGLGIGSAALLAALLYSKGDKK